MAVLCSVHQQRAHSLDSRLSKEAFLDLRR